MNLEKNLELNKDLLKKDISKYSSYFKKIDAEYSRKKGLSYKYNYSYEGDSILFIGYQINNLALKVKDNKIIKVYFEIYFTDKGIFKDLIKKFGYPDVGHVNPNLQYLEDSTKSRKDKSNYMYENYTGLTWTKDDEDTFMHITNLKNNNYFIDKEYKLWITFNIVK